MSKISDMVWAQYFKMDYAQSWRKDPKNAKKAPSQNFYIIDIDSACPFRQSGIYGIMQKFYKTGSIIDGRWKSESKKKGYYKM